MRRRLGYAKSAAVFPAVGALEAIFGKNLNHKAGLLIAAYVCVAYSPYEHRWLPLARLNVCLSGVLSFLIIRPPSSFPGMRAPPCSHTRGQYTFSFVPAFSNKSGIIHSILL